MSPCISRFIVAVLLLSSGSAYSQYALAHYIAPSPWSYFSDANEIVLTTTSATTVNVTVTKSDGTLLTTKTVVQGTPNRFRLTGAAGSVSPNVPNTILNAAGLIFTGDGQFGVNIRNVASDQVAGSGATTIKGNASLTSFGDQGLGTEFRVGYYRSSTTGFTVPPGASNAPVYSVMAKFSNTHVTINKAVPITITLNAGQSYLFQVPIGTQVTSDKPIVGTAGVWQDAPTGCGDGVVDQMIPVALAGNNYIIVRGSGTAGRHTLIIWCCENNDLSRPIATIVLY